jgi:type 1 glutamine amidotransferase
MVPKFILPLAALGALPLQELPVANPNRPAPTFDTVAPALPRLSRPAILVFSKTNSFRHDSIPAAVAAVERLVKARGWSVFATENAAVFDSKLLAGFDAVVFASATGDVFTPAQRTAFQRYLASGRGFVGLHGAGDSSSKWNWYVDGVIGARFVGHPGGAHQFQAADLLVTDRSHPATRHLPARWRWTDEYYSFAAPPPADARVLARLDETGMTLEPKLVMGDRHALVWWRCKGRARIFYSALGHNSEAFADPHHLKLIDGAIAWAARRQGPGCG